MPAIQEMRSIQKRTLANYLLVKKELDEKNTKSQVLDMCIHVAATEMDAEDVAYVEKMFAQKL